MEFNINPNCTEFIKSGVCNADCCGCVPMLEGYFKVLKKFIPSDKKYEKTTFKIDGQKWVKALSPDFKCAFLDKNNFCTIHNSHLRPDVCKKYGSSKIEPLLACPHINEDKKQYISDVADKTLARLVDINDPIALEMLSRSCS